MAVADDLRETLLTARQAMGPDAHPIHVCRLQLIWNMIQWSIKQDPDHWQAALARAERLVDASHTPMP
jgi:hypothetical protein